MSIKILQLKKATFAALFALLLNVAGMTNATAQTFTVGNLNYSLNDDGTTVTVTGHVDGQNATGELVIPESVELYGTTYSVTGIGDDAFYNCYGLTGSLIIPETVTIIGSFAFMGCGFETLTISSNMMYIEWGAFWSCSLTTLNWNAINSYCYYSTGSSPSHWLEGCPLSTINIGENVQVIPVGFLAGFSSITGELVIPQSVTTIGSNAFYGCSGFSGSLTVSEAVTSIGEDAFNGCSGFTGSLTIPNNVTTIGANAFSGCTSLSGTLTLGRSLAEIGNTAFFGACEGFSSFDVKAEIPPTLGTNVFTSMDNSIPVTVPCGSLDAYNNASGWDVFSNIQETNPCMWEITASANLLEGGTISGAGVYEQGQTCTLTATPNQGISFVNWTENGVEVSTDAQYAFTVTGNRQLVANFVIPTYIVNVTVNPSNGGSITIDGQGDHNICDFEDGTLGGWTTIDANGDGRDWMLFSNDGIGHNGSSYLVRSASYENGAITPDNYLVSPLILLEGSITFYACAHSTDYAAEHFGLAVSTTSNTDANAFSMIQEWTMTAKRVEGLPIGRTRGDGNRDQGNWYEYTVDLSAYSGMSGYVAIRHFNCYDQWYLYVDDICLPAYTKVYHPGDVCTLNAMPSSSDFVFVNWTEDGEVVSTNAQYSFTVMDNRNLVANFMRIRFDIMATADPEACGTVSGSGNYLVGQTCTLTATPNEGYEFYHWVENGEVVSTEAVYSFVVTTSRALTARFRTANPIIFADPNVEAICVANWDTDGDGFLSYTEAAAVTNLNRVFYYHSEITSFDELQYFTGLTQINYRDFYYCLNLTSIILPEGITSIGQNAFYYCRSLTGDLVIPNSVTEIQSYAFYGCDGFNGSLTLGANVNSIDGSAFGSASFTTVNYNAINCSYVEDWLWNPGAITTLNIGENVEAIPDGAFAYFSNVTGELVIPNSVVLIGNEAFIGCSSLTSVAFGNSLTSIGYSAFNSCSGLTSILIPNSVTEIGDWAFGNCSDLISASLPEGMTSINDGVFSECPSLTSVIFPGALETIGHYAFQSCGLTSLELPNTVTSIGIGAFSNCTSISGTLDLPASVATIGEQAFLNCTGLQGVILPEDIHSIGVRAFKNCSGLRGELTLPESLETVGGEAFYGCDGISTVNYNAINCQTMGNAGEPVFYDCAFPRLNIGENVTKIPDFAFKRCFMLTEMTVGAAVPPTIYSSTFGMVPRSIPVTVPFGSGDDYRNATYWEEFFNITEGYGPMPYANHWHPNAHQSAFNMSVIGVVQINGVEQSTNALEIGAFCGNECRGSKMLAYYPQIDRYVLLLPLYGEQDDQFTFRLYNHEQGEESLLACDEVIAFVPNGIVGTYQEPHVFNFISIQNTALAQGWNWYSSYVELGAGSLEMMTESMGANGLLVKSQSGGFVSYDSGEWFGTLSAVNNENTYLINTSANCVMSVMGDFVTPAQHPITIVNGWNWIGYPSTSTIDLNTALNGFAPHDGDIIKNQDNFSIYVEGSGWIGDFNTIYPGMGLMYNSLGSQPVTFTYSTGNSKSIGENRGSQDNHWVVNRQGYPYNMSVIAVVHLDGEELDGNEVELAAFEDDECRGSARLLYVEHLDRYIAFVTVSGDESAELTWKFYNPTTGMEYESAEHNVGFEPNGIVGSFDNPYVVDFSAMTATEEAFANRLAVYPNPVNANDRVIINMPCASKARVEVVSAIGAVVSAEIVTGTSATVKAPATPGVYVVKVAIDGMGTYTCKLVVE